MNPIVAIQKSLTLKVSLVLAGVIMILTALAGLFIVNREVESLESLTLEKGRLAATAGARAYASALEEGIDSGFLKVNDVFDHDYQLIKGYALKDPRYHTKFDFFTDAKVPPILDTFMQSEDVVYAQGSDTQGYIPTHDSVFSKPITGDVSKDLVDNRAKRIIANPVTLAAVKSEAPYIIQSYVRDNGQRTWDVAAPISVKGKHWGAFRLGVSVEHVSKLKTALMTTLVGVFLVFGLLTVGVVGLLVRRSMIPLVQLAQLADDISTGEKLDQPIKATRRDEIGMMTKSVERLRASLKEAMTQLGE